MGRSSKVIRTVARNCFEIVLKHSLLKLGKVEIPCYKNIKFSGFLKSGWIIVKIWQKVMNI